MEGMYIDQEGDLAVNMIPNLIYPHICKKLSTHMHKFIYIYEILCVYTHIYVYMR